MADDILILPALFGGVLIGVSATLMLWLCGRIAGVSGILNGILDRREGFWWRGAFLVGLLAGGAIWWLGLGGDPDALGSIELWHLVIGGFLVGFGTRLGSGCTSGHGVCGLGRLSLRSLVATIVFVTTGIISVFVMRAWGGV